MDASAAPSRQLVRMRGRSYVAFVFCPTVPIVGWLEEIDATLARSPGFFVGKPVVLDLSAVDLSQSAIAHLVRAMAGVNGNPAARIYCQKIEAELLAIDGYYQTAEDISAMLRNRPAQAWLDGEIMRITPLN